MLIDLRFCFVVRHEVRLVAQIMVGDDGYGVPNRFGRVGAIPLKAIRVGLNHMPTGHNRDLLLRPSPTGRGPKNTATRVPVALSQNTLSVQIVICPSLSRLPACPRWWLPFS